MDSKEDIVSIVPRASWLHSWLACWPTVESPRSYLVFSGLAMLGAAYGRSAWLNQEWRKLYPMLNLLLIGPSGIGKTTALEIGMQYLIEPLPDDMRPQIIAGQPSPEKLHADLATEPHSIIYAEELASFITKQRYMESMVPYLCLPIHIPVLTTDLRWVPVGDLKVRDEIIGCDEEGCGRARGRKLRRAIVEATGRKVLPCVNIETDRNTTTASRDHPFLVKRYWGDQWVPARLLKPGDKVRYLCAPWVDEATQESGYLAALFDGEGHVSKDRVGFNQNEGSVLNEGIRLLKKHGFETSKYLHEEPNDKCKVVTILGGIHERLRFLGSIRPIRLLENSEKAWLGRRISSSTAEWATVVEVTEAGLHEVVPLQTSTRTLISDGYFTHNTELLNYKAFVEKRSHAHDIVRVELPETTVLGGSTVDWLQEQLPDSAVGGGFLPRFLIVYEEYKFKKIALPEQSIDRATKLRLDRMRKACFDEFMSLLLNAPGACSFGDYGVADIYTYWYSTRKPISGHLEPFSQRAGEYVLRLSLLLALSCGRSAIIEDDIHAAIKLYEYTEQSIQRVVVPMTPKGKLLQKVMELVSAQPVSQTTIRRAMRNYVTSREADEFVESLIASKEIMRLAGDNKLVRHGRSE